MMKFTDSRLNHSLNVARKMKEIIQNNPYLFTCKPEEGFYLGIVHDIAYEFVEDPIFHEHKGGELLKELGFKYWREVYYHGDPDANYISPELMLLNYADLITGPNGENLTISERLIDIANRYGESSIQYIKAKRLSEKVICEFVPKIKKPISDSNVPLYY